MKEQVKSLHLEAEHHNRDREAMTKWAFKCETPARIEACLTLAASDPDIAITTEDMDKDLMLFNFNNGTYDLEHDMFLPHDKLQNITKTCGYNYDPVARCPEWERFIERLFRSLPENDKKEIMEYIQKCVGYTLTGYTSEQIIILLHGSGGNGKSVFNECLRMLFGDYGMTIAAKTLTTDGDKQIRNDIAGLRGARFVSASENAKKSTLDEELIKKLTGGEPVQARFLNKEFFSFVPTLKLWWSFNHAPKLNDQTESIWRRVRLIPFNETFSEVERKPMNELMDIFSKELSGIFNWALYGFKKYKKNGLKSANIVESAVKSFREECDILYEWKIQNVIDAEPTTINGLNIVHEIKSTELYQNYITWCSYNHEKDIMNITRFGVELKERGFKKTRKNNGWYYVGIKFTQRI
jgi:putative DNA primase/helicase